MFCMKCGNRLEEGQAFCPKCGTKVQSAQMTIPTEKTQIEASENEQQEKPETNITQADEKTTSDEISADDCLLVKKENEETQTSEPLTETLNNSNAEEEIQTPQDAVQTARNDVPRAEERKIPENPTFQKSESKVKKAVVAFFSVILAILFFALCTLTLALIAARGIANVDLIEIISYEIDVDVITVDDKSLTEYIADYVTEAYDTLKSSDKYSELLDDYNFNEQKLDNAIGNFLNEDCTRDFIYRLLSNYIEDIVYSTGEGSIDVSDITEFLSNNSDEIYEATGYMITSENIELLSEYIDENVDFSELSAEVIADEYDLSDVVSYMNLLTSNFTLIVSAVIAFLFALQIFLMNGKKFTRSMLYVAIPAAISGAIFMLVGLLMSSFVGILNEILPFGESVYLTIIESVKPCFLTPGIITFIIGAVVIVAAIIINVVTKKRASNIKI